RPPSLEDSLVPPEGGTEEVRARGLAGPPRSRTRLSPLKVGRKRGGAGVGLARRLVGMEQMSGDPLRFDREEAAEILDLAAAIEEMERGDDLDLTLVQVQSIAAELGISSSAVRRAIDTRNRDDRRSAKLSRKSIRRRMRFIRHAAAYAVTIAILAVVDVLDGGGWWFFYVAGFWGIALALHGLRFVTRSGGPLHRRIT
ncbi:hypothetical protein MNBD_ACTINO01-2499, partial [hydrothermal vent metagenome]